jgi:hypothetical protein
LDEDGSPVVPTQVKDDAQVEHAIFNNCEQAILETTQLKNTAPKIWDYLYDTNSGDPSAFNRFRIKLVCLVIL